MFIGGEIQVHMIAAFGSPWYIKAWLNEFAINGEITEMCY